MSNVSGQGTTWNLLNYVGELFTADLINTPFLSMIGGLTGGVMTDNFEFPTSSEYAHEALAQETITETDSLTPPTVITYVRTQVKNVVQIFQEQISLTYVRMANQGRLSGINTAGSQNNVPSELDFQIARALEAIARKVEWHFLQGTYAIATNTTEPNQTRGMMDLCEGATTVNTVAAGSTALTKTLVDTLLLEMFTNGAIFRNPVIFCNGFQKQGLSNIYGYAPEDRNVGGVNIKQIETDFGNIGVAPAHRFMPAAKLLVAEMSVISPVFQPVPGKGNLFYEPLARTGAAETGMLFGQIGLNHGPAYMHGTITGLTTS